MIGTEHERDVAFGFLDRGVISPRRFNPRLIANDGRDTMLRAIRRELAQSDSFVFSVAFITPGALASLKQCLRDFTGRAQIVTSTYLGFNSPRVFEELLNLPGIEVLLLEDPAEGFHAKGYLFRQAGGATAIVGSSNLTESALQRNHEWNLRFSALADGDIVNQLESLIARQVARAVPLTAAWIEGYRDRWVAPGPRGPGPTRQSIVPNAMQTEALAQIDLIRGRGERRAIVVSATGTGKTILAALDVRAVDPGRLLFVVHREQILDKAIGEFRRVLDAPAADFGKVAGGRRELDRRYVFASIQSLSSPGLLESIPPGAFDYVLVDEVHKAGAASYARLLEKLEPRFLLGMTATPERSDGCNIFELFDFNLAYEIRLQRAMEAGMLAPFHYYGVTDYVTGDGEVIDDLSPLAALVGSERVEHLLRAVDAYGQVGTPVRGLIFCSRRDEAQELSRILNTRTLRGRRLRTRALSGLDPVPVREAAVRDLEDGKLDYLLTVDIFNEGIDVPTLNQVVMLRQTQSSIVFTQQLGRGLRKAPGKDYLVVIDFIGNYANNYLIPIALFGDTSLSKDSVRQKMIEAQEAGSIAGLSSVNFDSVAREQVFKALAKVKLDSMVNLKGAYLEMENRVGRLPDLLDFARFDALDPVVLASKAKNYWAFQLKLGRVAEAPTPDMSRWLDLITLELLNGKRPHELALLDVLIRCGDLSPEQVAADLRSRGCGDEAAVRHAISVLRLDFFPAKDRPAYLPVLTRSDARVELTPEFRDALRHPRFAHHVHDLIGTGLFLARHRHDFQGRLRVGARYSRKDVCRLLNWSTNQASTVYGYKVDGATRTCPIFVTYHKHSEVAATLAYGDEFIDESTLRWFTRSKRRLDSPEVRSITQGRVTPHVFVKRDDAEGLDFLYLGTARPVAPRQESMRDGTGGVVPVVTMRLEFETPIERGLFDYLTEAPGGDGPVSGAQDVSWEHPGLSAEVAVRRQGGDPASRVAAPATLD